MIKANFVYDSETKNKFKYQEAPETNFVGTLYLSKHAFGGEKPEKIILTVEKQK